MQPRHILLTKFNGYVGQHSEYTDNTEKKILQQWRIIHISIKKDVAILSSSSHASKATTFVTPVELELQLTKF